MVQGICSTQDIGLLKISFHQSIAVSSNSYPKPYSRGIGEYCLQKYYADRGAFKIQFLDTRIALGDNIGIGVGLALSLTSTVYGISAAAKSPSADNFPRSVYVLPTQFLGSTMWMLFAAADQHHRYHYAQELHQGSTIAVGFMIKITLVEETVVGMFNDV